MNDIVAVVVVLVVAGVWLLFWLRRASPQLASWTWLAFLAHIVAAASMVWITRDYYGYGDMLAYHRTGVRLADGMANGFIDLEDVLRLLFQRSNNIIGVHGNGWSTGSMHAIAALLARVFDGSLMAICMATAMFSLSGKLSLWRGLTYLFPSGHARPLFVGCLFFPSVVFWTSGLLKETFAMAGLGWLFLGYARIVALRRLDPWWSAMSALGAVVVGLTKSYVLFAFALAASASWIVAEAHARRPLQQRVVRIGLAGLLAAVLTVGLGLAFPRYATENLADEVSNLRELGRTHAGGSTFVADDATLSATQVPLGVVNALFRPFLFEARNPLMVLGALETTILLLAVLLVIRQPGVRRGLRATMRHPGLSFCATFTIVFAVAVGVSTTNLGTLSRYRVPMFPFYVAYLTSIYWATVNASPSRSDQTRARR